jgi:hypothetical protein
MAFVNEYVSEEEAKKYDLDGINRQFMKAPDIRYDWTIDRERGIRRQRNVRFVVGRVDRVCLYLKDKGRASI